MPDNVTFPYRFCDVKSFARCIYKSAKSID